MELSATIVSGDYTTTPAWVEVECGVAPGSCLLKRVKAVLSGNLANAEIGIYQYDAGESLPTAALRALVEEFYDDAVAPATAPAPELDISPTAEVEFEFVEGNSFYVTLLAGAGDVAVSGTVKFYIESLEE
jgi:hypothetical protein